MALSLVLAGSAWADPLAQRLAGPEAIVVSLGGASGALGAGPVTLGAEVAFDGGRVGAFVGDRWERAGGRGGTLAAGGAASLLALPVARGVGLGVAPWVGAWRRGRVGSVGLTVAAPLEAGTGGVGALRLPLAVTGEVGLRAGPARVGLALGAGAAWTPGLDVSAVGTAAVWVAGAGG